MTVEAARKELMLECLSELERRETELLSWGAVDGYFDEQELLEIIEEFLSANDREGAFENEEELLDALLNDVLVFELPGVPPRYRTRMAEGIRLLFRLRQVLHWRAWHEAQNLIADYRLILRPRRFPRRDVSPNAVQKVLAPVLTSGSPVERQIVDVLTGADCAEPLSLAGFQAAAAERVLREVRNGRKSGTIVCAGTGSGKTLAFYLPALIALSRWSDQERWTRCLSLYPRNELLKDQLSTAVKRVREVNEVLRATGRRPLQVGAIFSAVPTDSSSSDKWPRLPGAQASLCPYLACPGCNQMSLTWLDEDRTAGVEVLKCSHCDVEVGADLFAITRTTMINAPPDLLFTSLEMVNQRMSDPKLGRLLGLGQPRHKAPRLVLLDEVHTYEGVYGAQAALLIRRWKEATGAVPHFVGLSATLADARRFFAELINEAESVVEEVSPRPADLISEGQEYMLALRGDPISNTNLLSASIQVAMLLRRILDTTTGENSSAFGTRVFGFTDNLDVINRLYHDLVDAEGWVLGRDGRPFRRAANGPNAPISEPWLAAYRAVNRPEHTTRWELGQSWDLCDRIGHRLNGNDPPVRVGRTSSQDSGVDANAEIVIATASLEVGYDDPSVGAVFQHKAPQSAAAFLQRKGRAGRQRGMRPWTVVVLSCYGRDRAAYEAYDQLFSPELKPRHLPLSNRYVLRIQATYALMDWLSKTGSEGHIWQLLAEAPAGKFTTYTSARQKQIIKRAASLLDDPRQEGLLHGYLRSALGVDDATVRSLMWAPPRSLMMSVLPTIVRRLDRAWAHATAPGSEERVEPSRFWSPLPEFIPANLFSDLNVPEVQLRLPDRREPESMGIRQALQEFSPGRVSLRFGVASRQGSYWIPVARGQTRLRLDDICPLTSREELGEWAYPDKGAVRRVRVVRPYCLDLSQPPSEISSSSNSRLIWATQILPSSEASMVGFPKASPWSDVVTRIAFYMHAHANPVEVRRFAVGSEFTLKRQGEEDFQGTLQFADQSSDDQSESPAALGYVADADGVCISVAVPTDLHRRLWRSGSLLRSTRTALFRHRLTSHEALSEISNVFQRDWLARIYLGAVVLAAEHVQGSLEDGHRDVLLPDPKVMREVLDIIFRALGDEDDEDQSTRRGQLISIMADPAFRRALEECAPTLWESPNEGWETWLSRRYRATLTVALRETAQRLCPDMNTDDLCPDIDPGLRGDLTVEDELWLTESTLGGGGVIEALHQSYTRDPRRFLDILDAALAPADLEDVHTELKLVLGWLHEETDRGRAVRRALADVRAAEGHSQMLEAELQVRRTLGAAGLRTTHAVMTALHTRILRPGSSIKTDELLHTLLRRWETLEERLGIEVDTHVFAYVCTDSNHLDEALRSLGLELGSTNRAQWRFDTLYGLLWSRGGSVRAAGLHAHNPYQPLPETDRLLVLHAQDRRRRQVALGSQRWLEFLRGILAEDGIADLTAPTHQRRELANAVKTLLVEPVDLGFIMGFPLAHGVLQEGDQLTVVFEIPEVIQ
ncbi:MAG: protein DpdJ [Polyangiaceae bacterium]